MARKKRPGRPLAQQASTTNCVQKMVPTGRTESALFTLFLNRLSISFSRHDIYGRSCRRVAGVAFIFTCYVHLDLSQMFVRVFFRLSLPAQLTLQLLFHIVPEPPEVPIIIGHRPDDRWIFTIKIVQFFYIYCAASAAVRWYVRNQTQ
jgi:hypothetical protein